MNKDYSKTIANTIYQQIGGNRFKTMTGAKSFVIIDSGLQFDLPNRFAKNGINRITVKLDPSDTYTVTAFKLCRKSMVLSKMEEESMIYCDMLEDIFTSFTGLVTRL